MTYTFVIDRYVTKLSSPSNSSNSKLIFVQDLLQNYYIKFQVLFYCQCATLNCWLCQKYFFFITFKYIIGISKFWFSQNCDFMEHLVILAFFLQICDIIYIIFQLDINAGKCLKYYYRIFWVLNEKFIDAKIVKYKT